ncbi:hypothetical protein OGAPHI_006419 [Ogataea philodendri]|uniref:Uncharacterized protein n=1 Tax=Ogataea philodendri TaxID=1378263 RepID=A0A9P8NYH7_9ASCO|nr:uncharacterized protein OGAPHI_006419 [Ogataea philodendri]KAH3661571.1 hypothetical protein OGAPHI_006419 [Ogataea philodendri]
MGYSRTFLTVPEFFTAVSNPPSKEQDLLDHLDIADQPYVHCNNDDLTVALFTKRLKGFNPGFLNAMGLSYLTFCEYFIFASEVELIIAMSFFEMSDPNQLLFSTINWGHHDTQNFLTNSGLWDAPE